MKKLLLTMMMVMGWELASAQTTAQWPEVNHEAKPASRWWIMGSAFDETSVNNRMAEYAAAGLGCSRGDRPLVERYLEPGGLFPTMHG